MNLAISAVGIFLVALPGLLFRRAFLRGPRGFPVAPRPLVDEVALSVVLAAPLHVAWGSIVQHVTRFLGWPGLDIDLESTAMLLLGQFGDESKDLPDALASVTEHPCAVTVYFLLLYVFSGVFGVVAHMLCWKYQPLRNSWFVGFQNRWFDLIDGTLAKKGTSSAPSGLVYCIVAAIVEVGKEAYIYEGLLADAREDLTFDANGNLYDLTLRGTRRRKLSDDPAPGTPDKFFPIHGDLFVLRYEHTKTINFNYVEVVEIPVTGSAGTASAASGTLTVTRSSPPDDSGD